MKGELNEGLTGGETDSQMVVYSHAGLLNELYHCAMLSK